MRALITGGAGFIGSHLAEVLLARGDDVHVVDDLSTGSMHNITHLKANPGFSYTLGSVMDRRTMAEQVDLADVVYHLAAAVGVQLIVESPVRTIETNVRGTEVVLEMAAKKNRKVLLTSTSEVYGKSTAIPFVESGDLTLGSTHLGRWSYACSKALDEFLALAYWKEKGLPVTVARLFNTVGPRQIGRYGMVIPRLVGQALAGEPITVYGDGSQQRSFTWVHDAVGALVDLMDADAANGEVYNIGSTQEISILALAELIKERTGSSSPIVFVPYDQAYAPGFEDMMRRLPSLAKIHALTGYEPSRTVAQIIDGVIDSLR
ncbi:MAG: GDP-mannose 4,6-dehydratase [Deltaproteobacteria bacterium]|nr:GDP-mannose 4,6-dehydratase [Deltaproteobacteria bacterium]